MWIRQRSAMMYFDIYASMWQGTYTALITPFCPDASFDRDAFANLIEEQIAAQVEGIVVCGTTGESPTLSHQENIDIIKVAIDIVQKRTKVIAGTGSNCTREAICMTEKAAANGADAALIVVPYYNKPSQEGLFLHFQAIAQSTPDLPIILYDVPGRTGVRLASETILRLATIPNIVSLKDATGDFATIDAIIEKLPADFTILSGNDDMTLPLIKKGAQGVISVASNVRAEQMKALVDAALVGDFSTAEKIDAELVELFELCFVEANPTPIKTILALQGKCEEVFRLPLCPLDAQNRQKVAKSLKQ